MNLENSELLEIRGGAKTGWGAMLFLVLGGVITLLAGVIDGITNPFKCREVIPKGE